MIRIYNKNFLILLVAFVGASAFRVFLNESEYLDKVVAFINIASILYVLYLILEQAGEYLSLLLDKNKTIFGEKVANKKKMYYKKKANFLNLIFLFIGILYPLFFANAIINDIIGFIALFLSIETEYIANGVGNMFYKKK